MHILFYRHRTSSTTIHCGEQVASYCSRKIRSKGLTMTIKQTTELSGRKLSGLLASGCEKNTSLATLEAVTAEKKNGSLKPAHCYTLPQLSYKAIVFAVSLEISSSYERRQPSICHQVLAMQVSFCSSTLDVFSPSPVLK